MKDINLIVSQEKLKQNRKNALLKEATKRNYKKQQKIKKICIGIAIGLAIAYFIGLILLFEIKLKQKGIQGCMENGYSYNYCVEHS